MKREEAGSPVRGKPVLDAFSEQSYPECCSSPLEKAVVGTPVRDKSVARGSDVRSVPMRSWPQKLISDAAAHPWMIYKVFSFLPWSQRSSDLLCVSPALHKFFNPRKADSKYWRWLIECLCAESMLYLPASEASVRLMAGGDEGDFCSLFKQLWLLRHRFVQSPVGEETTASPENFRLSTYCRMRPAPPATLDGEDAFEMLKVVPVTLPLNQRVALLQQKNPKLTRAEAMKMLLNKVCGSAGPLPEEPDDEDEEQTAAPVEAPTKVDSAETQTVTSAPGFSASVLSVTPGQQGSVLTVSPGIGLRSWEFANVFDQQSAQQDVYERCGMRLAIGLVNGASGALIVYGQTGSGKTHTMFGPPNRADGLLPKVADEVLAALELRRASGFEVHLAVSLIEVFGQDVSNLLGGEIGANRAQNQRMSQKYVLEGRCDEPVPDRETFLSLLARAEDRKRKASTKMNERSTRAHTLVILKLRQRSSAQESFVESCLSLVDLGGSEKITKSKANEGALAPGGVNCGEKQERSHTWAEYYKSRERLTETNHINKGLLTLKRCVQALNERQQCAKDGKPLPRVPFNDSKLTMLLQPALNGESFTSVVVCCSTEEKHAEETVQSLRFGELCSCVQHEGVTGKKDANTAVAAALKQIDAEIKDLEAIMLKKERSEWKTTKRVDVIDEMDTAGAECNLDEQMELGGKGAVEFKKDDGKSKKMTQEHEVRSWVTVGAEAESARRDELIRTRQRLLGDE